MAKGGLVGSPNLILCLGLPCGPAIDNNITNSNIEDTIQSRYLDPEYNLRGLLPSIVTASCTSFAKYECGFSLLSLHIYRLKKNQKEATFRLPFAKSIVFIPSSLRIKKKSAPYQTGKYVAETRTWFV